MSKIEAGRATTVEPSFAPLLNDAVMFRELTEEGP
jgi:hypothetical protein